MINTDELKQTTAAIGEELAQGHHGCLCPHDHVEKPTKKVSFADDKNVTVPDVDERKKKVTNKEESNFTTIAMVVGGALIVAAGIGYALFKRKP